MQSKLKQLTNLKNFDGLRNFEEPNNVPPSKLYRCQNARFSKFVISSKNGYQALGDALAGGTKDQGVYSYLYTNTDGSVDDRLLRFYNKTFYKFDTATQTSVAIPTVWPTVADSYTDGVQYSNAMYFVNPLTGVSNTTSARISAGTITGIALKGATLSQAVSTATGPITNVIRDTLNNIIGFDVDPIVGTFDTTNIVTGTNPPTSGSIFISGLVGSPIVGALLVQAVTLATAKVTNVILNSTGVATAVYAENITGAFNNVNNVVGTNSDASVFNFTPSGVTTSTTFTFTPTVVSYYYDGVGKIEDGTFSVVHNSPRGIAMESFGDSLWVIGDPGSAPGSFIASRSGATDKTKVEDWTVNTIAGFVGKGGKNVAIRVLEDNLYIFKNDSIWYKSLASVISGDTITEATFQELSRTGGAVNQKSTIVVENDVWFVTPTNEIRSLGKERNLGDNPRTRELSSIIKRTMETLDLVNDNPVMSYHDRVVKLQMRTKDSPTNNITICFEYNTGGFTVDRGQAVNVVTNWRGYSTYGEDATTGQLYLDDTGFSNNGTEIVFQADTPFMDGSRPDLSNRARYIYFRGQLSYNQSATLKLYRGNYDTYTSYTIPSPYTAGIALDAPASNATWGSSTYGSAPWGGSSTDSGDIKLYRIEKLISVDRRANMFAIGIDAQVNGGKIVVEQLITKVIPDNENYKRADI